MRKVEREAFLTLCATVSDELVKLRDAQAAMRKDLDQLEKHYKWVRSDHDKLVARCDRVFEELEVSHNHMASGLEEFVLRCQDLEEKMAKGKKARKIVNHDLSMINGRVLKVEGL